MFISGLTIDGYVALSGVLLSGNAFSLCVTTSAGNCLSDETIISKNVVEHVSCPECSVNYFLKHNLSRHLLTKHSYDRTMLSGFNEKNKNITTMTEQEFYARTRLTHRQKTPKQKKALIKKIKDTKRELYGDENFCNVEKIKQHMLDKYGVENPFQAESIKAKIKQNTIEKYGQEHWVQTDEFKQKSAETCMKNYGVDNPWKSRDVIDKIQDTQRKKYGGKLFLQTDKCMESKYKKKRYVCPSGRVIMVQGYGGRALDILYKEYSETDILFSTEITTAVGEFWYKMGGKMHRYFPDIYIKSINTIIEVKSSYTFKADLIMNVLKRKCCIMSGINFEFMVL